MLLRFEQVELLISKRKYRTWQQAFWSTCKTMGHIHRGARLHPIYQLSLDAAEHPSSSNALLARLSVGDETTAFRSRSRRQRLLSRSLLVCLPRNPTRRPRLNRSFLLQTASSTRRFRLRGMFLQRFHRDTVLECGLVCGVEEDPRVKKFSIHAQADRYHGKRD